MGVHHCIFVVLVIVSYSSTKTLQKNSLAYEILDDLYALKHNDFIQSIWEREPSVSCNIVKPSEENLINNGFVQFNFVPVLCMILYDASLKCMSLNTTLLQNMDHNISQIINQSLPHNFCQLMEKNKWYTRVNENEQWVSNLDKIMRKGALCQRFCVSEDIAINQLCILALKLNLLAQSAEHILVETSHLKSQDNSKTQAPLVTNTKQAHSPTAVDKTDNAQPSHLISDNNGNAAQKIDNKELTSNKLTSNDNDSGAKTLNIPNVSNAGLHSKAQNFEDLRAQPKEALGKIEDGIAGHLHTGNSEKDPAKRKPIIQNPSAKQEYTSGSDILKPKENFKQASFLNQPQPPKGGTTSTNLPQKDEQNVSVAPSKPPSGNVKIPKEITASQIHGDTTVPDNQNKMVGGSTVPNEEKTESQKTTDNSSSMVKLKPSAPGSVPIPETQKNNHPNKVSVNTTDTAKEEKTKLEFPKEHLEGFSKLPQPLDQIGRSEIDEAFTANELEFDYESPSDPDDHEDKKKFDDGVVGNKAEVENPGLGGVNSPQVPEDDAMESQDPVSEEPRFENGDSPPKPEPSTKVAVDYAAASEEDEDTMWHPDGKVTQNDAGAGFPRDRFIDAEDSHFFAYFMTMIILCILGYLIFHNKQKILALALEGRVRKGARRRPSTSGYRKLDSNLEEAVTSSCTGSSVTHVIY